MRLPKKWLAPMFLGMVIVAAVAAGACGNDPARPVLLTAPDSSRGDSTPGDSTPPDSVPSDTIPPDTLPPPSGSASLTVTPASQERAVGDSGIVGATLRDSTGREVFPAPIEWDLSDTSTVLRIRVRGTSYVVFNSVGVGRAVLIARFGTLADTALVFVR